MKIDTTKRLKPSALQSPVHTYLSEYPSFLGNQTVDTILELLRSREKHTLINYLYIVDDDNCLVGILTLDKLIYNAPNTLIIDLIDTDILKIEEDASLEKGLKIMTHNQLLILPVVDKDNHFLGALELLHYEHEMNYQSKREHKKSLKEDIFQFIGLSLEERKYNSSWLEFRYRMPWLLCNLFGGLICAVISQFFKLTLMEFVLLAFFIPLVLTLSESVSMQSMTLSLRFLHIRKIHWIQVWRRFLVESRASFLLGVTSAILISGFYFAWSVDLTAVFAIAISIITAMMVSALFGGFFPIFLHAIRLDPKVAAGPLVLMMVDIFTITIYLTLSTLMLM